MLLYLFGGHSEKNKTKHWQIINRELNKIKPKQILYVGSAKEHPKKSFSEFKKTLKLVSRCRILDASNQADLKLVKQPLIFISGGPRHIALNRAIQNKLLRNLILGAKYYFGSSVGATLVGAMYRKYPLNMSPLIYGLGIIKNTIIESHYHQQDRHELLRTEMRESNSTLGIGLDECAGIKIDSQNFPQHYEILAKTVELVFL